MKRVVMALFLALGVALAGAAPQETGTAKKPAAKKTGAAAKKTGAKGKLVPPKERKPVTTPSGLQYEDIVVGNGPQPKTGDTVVVHYTGRLTNGKQFDSSVGKQPFEFQVGRGQVIKGWDEGVGSMNVGGKRKLTIPPELAYGSRDVGNGLIPPNSTLVFDVELLRIK